MGHYCLRRLDESSSVRALTPKEWEERFKNLNSIPDKAPSRSQGQAQQGTSGIPLDPNACAEIEYLGKGQTICHLTQKDRLKDGIPKEIPFPAPAQRLNSTDWTKRFGAPPASPTPPSPAPSAVSVPPSSPSALVDPQSTVPPNFPTPDWSARFGTSKAPPTSEKESHDGDASDSKMNAKQSLKDRLSSKIKSIKDTVSATADKIRQETSLTGMCQRSRAETLYSKAYADLSVLEQRGIDVECAAVRVDQNTTIDGRVEYGSGVVESGGKLLHEAGRELGSPNEP